MGALYSEFRFWRSVIPPGAGFLAQNFRFWKVGPEYRGYEALFQLRAVGAGS